MSAKKLKLDESGNLQNTPIENKHSQIVSIEDINSLFERLDSLDYKLWELLKIAKAFAKTNNLEINNDE